MFFHPATLAYRPNMPHESSLLKAAGVSP